MTPPAAGGGGRPEGEPARATERDFGSFEAFMQVVNWSEIGRRFDAARS